MPVLTTNGSTPNAEPVKSYLQTCPDHLMGAILMSGAYGLKEPGKRYPEYWHWPTFQNGNPAACLDILNHPRYLLDSYGFYSQLWCGVLAPPEKPDDLTCLCAQLENDSLKQGVEAMIPTRAKLYPSAFDLYEIFEELGLTERHPRQAEQGAWLAYEEVNHDRPALERVLQHLLGLNEHPLLVNHLQRLRG